MEDVVGILDDNSNLQLFGSSPNASMIIMATTSVRRWGSSSGAGTLSKERHKVRQDCLSRSSQMDLVHERSRDTSLTGTWTGTIRPWLLQRTSTRTLRTSGE